MKKYDYKQAEQKYQRKWQEEQTYAYKPASPQEKFIIDTPPPTVSGDLHLGHVFSYTQTDIMARYKRMSGYNVFYPMGFDDNGLPTEKRIQNLYHVQCDSKKESKELFLNSHQDLGPETLDQIKAEALQTKSRPVYRPISRKHFLEICHHQVLEDEKKYKKLWSHISLSVDWSQSYQTIGAKAMALSQYSFLDLCEKKAVENRLSPVLWDTQFETAVASADVEEREQDTFYHHILFHQEGGGDFTIATTRPELLPACVAVVAHPEDERYKKLFGKFAITPLFGRSVPIIPSSHADPEKGTGILMVCTFGDRDDVEFCRKQKLETLSIIGDSGFLKEIDFSKEPFKSQNPQEAQKYYSHLEGLRVKQARKKLVEILKEKNCLVGESQASRHHVKFYEKGDFPLEILSKRQWYIKILDHKEAFLKLADQVQWHPSRIKNRYVQWVEGLNQDWCISRQRAYGVPFPVWYALDENGKKDYNKVLLAKPSSLLQNPVDPQQHTPIGFEEDQRDKAKGFTAETDVMDTWASSSLTPFINSGWFFDSQKHKSLFPADLRPQAHEIIRTWAFYTLVKSYFHKQAIPWKNIAISGWVMSPNKKKMSKSKGNAFHPENLIENYSADAIRYWAAKAGLAQDTVYDENLFRIGKRLSTKIFNAAQFVSLQCGEKPWRDLKSCLKKINQKLDQAWLLTLLETHEKSLELLKNYEHHQSLNLIEKQFWLFCDDYLELVKARAYQLRGQEEGLSATHSLDLSLFLFLKLFAPFFPYVTEEIWQSRYSSESSSLHNSLYLNEEEKGLLKSQWDSRSEKSIASQKESVSKLSPHGILETAFTVL